MTCAFLPCADVAECALIGGPCPQFVQYKPARELRDNARALAGIKPARTNRDPALIKRTRKVVLAPLSRKGNR